VDEDNEGENVLAITVKRREIQPPQTQQRPEEPQKKSLTLRWLSDRLVAGEEARLNSLFAGQKVLSLR
jgi:hypothetical protein